MKKAYKRWMFLWYMFAPVHPDVLFTKPWSWQTKPISPVPRPGATDPVKVRKRRPDDRRNVARKKRSKHKTAN